MARRVVQEILEDENVELFVPRKRFRDHLNPFDGYSEKQIYDRYRFPPVVIFELIELVNVDLEYLTKRSAALTPLQQMCCALRYLASNSFQSVVGDTLHFSKSTSNTAIWKVINAIVRRSEQFILFPNEEQLPAIKRGFFEKANFPNVVGLVDGTHVKVIVPKDIEYVYVNRKSFHSINVQVILILKMQISPVLCSLHKRLLIQGVCNHNGEFIHISAKWPGSAHDSRVFRNSPVPDKLRAFQSKHKILRYRVTQNKKANGSRITSVISVING